MWWRPGGTCTPPWPPRPRPCVAPSDQARPRPPHIVHPPDAPRLLRGRTVPSPARRGPVRPRAHDDDDVLPILGPHTKTEFTPEELDKLAHPHLLGGKTMGDELGAWG